MTSLCFTPLSFTFEAQLGARIGICLEFFIGVMI